MQHASSHLRSPQDRTVPAGASCAATGHDYLGALTRAILTAACPQPSTIAADDSQVRDIQDGYRKIATVVQAESVMDGFDASVGIVEGGISHEAANSGRVYCGPGTGIRRFPAGLRGYVGAIAISPPLLAPIERDHGFNLPNGASDHKRPIPLPRPLIDIQQQQSVQLARHALTTRRHALLAEALAKVGRLPEAVAEQRLVVAGGVMIDTGVVQ